MRLLKSIVRAIWMVSLAVVLLFVCSSNAQAGFFKRFKERRSGGCVSYQTSVNQVTGTVSGCVNGKCSFK